MANILETIITAKRLEVAERQKQLKISDLQAFPAYKQKSVSLKEALKQSAHYGIIAEFKRKSPG